MVVTELKNLDSLIKKSEHFLFSKEDAPEMDYSTKDNGLSIIYDGYTALPELYHEVFLDPLKNLISAREYSSILNADEKIFYFNQDRRILL